MRKEYTDAEHAIICAAYAKLAAAQRDGIKLAKAPLVREVMAETGRTRGAVEAKFMNISHVCQVNALLPYLPNGYVKGYKPAPNGAKALLPAIRAALGV